MGADRLRRQHNLTGRLRCQLDFTGFFQVIHAQERLADGLAHGQQTMVAQHQHRLVAEVSHQALLLVHVQRHALVVVVSDLAVELHGDLVDRQ
ncbi:hypothetical protein D9M71_501540 [compost metagenome]